MEEQNTNTQPQAQTVPPVPGAIMALVFGIISLVFIWFFLVPFLGLVLNITGLILGILAMKKGKKAMLDFEATPDIFSKGSFGLSKLGKVFGLIGLILNAIFLIVSIITSILGGAFFSYIAK